MDKTLRETTNLCVEIMNSRRQAKEKRGHVVQIRVWRFDVNVMLNLSNELTLKTHRQLMSLGTGA